MDIDDIKCEEKVKTVNILGTEYTIEHRKEADDPKLADGIDGYCDTSVKLLVICDFEQDEQSKEDLQAYGLQVLRHEIIHAFMYESGLDVNTYCFQGGWATNEEMIDWFAIQASKIFKAFEDVGCL